MTIHPYSVNKLSTIIGTLLLLPTATVAHAQMPRPAPPYLQANAQFISVGVTFAEAALRKILPPNVRPTPNIYQAPAGYALAPLLRNVPVGRYRGYDSPDGAKRRWMLHGVYGPEPVPTALRENLGWPVRVGASRSEMTERGKRGLALLGDREVISVEIRPSTKPCRPINGTVNYLSQLGPSKKLVLNEIPYVGELCGAEAIAVKVQAPGASHSHSAAPSPSNKCRAVAHGDRLAEWAQVLAHHWSQTEATMSDARESFFERVNHARYRAGQPAGHYESFFQRANDPERGRAFWIRDTMFSPEGRPQEALGELWAIYFDGETGQHVAVKTEVSFGQCVFRTSEFFVKVGNARLGPGRLIGKAASRGHTIEWDLRFQGDATPLLLLPLELYDSEFLRAKTLVGLPRAVYRGSLTVDGKTIEVADWVGSQNHKRAQENKLTFFMATNTLPCRYCAMFPTTIESADYGMPLPSWDKLKQDRARSRWPRRSRRC